MNSAFNAEVIEIIMRILKKGNSAEIKKEKDNIVIVEIDRRVRKKTSING